MIVSGRSDAHGQNQISVVIVDDHELIRRGVREVLESSADLLVSGEAGSVSEALDVIEQVRPDVVLMDVRLADGSGITATRTIRSRRPSIRVLILTSFRDEEALFAAIMAGASGFVLKEIRGDRLVEAIRAVARGANLLDPEVTGIVLDRLRAGGGIQDERMARLSPQEERILSLVADGRTNADIARELHLAEKTVKNYVSTILHKLEVVRRTEAAAYFSRRRGFDS